MNQHKLFNKIMLKLGYLDQKIVKVLEPQINKLRKMDSKSFVKWFGLTAKELDWDADIISDVLTALKDRYKMTLYHKDVMRNIAKHYGVRGYF